MEIADEEASEKVSKIVNSHTSFNQKNDQNVTNEQSENKGQELQISIYELDNQTALEA